MGWKQDRRPEGRRVWNGPRRVIRQTIACRLPRSPDGKGGRPLDATEPQWPRMNLDLPGRLVPRPGDNCGCRAPHRYPGKAPPAANGPALGKGGNAAWVPVGGSLRAGRKEVARGVASLGKGWAIPGETRLALNPFAARCIRNHHLDGVHETRHSPVIPKIRPGTASFQGPPPSSLPRFAR